MQIAKLNPKYWKVYNGSMYFYDPHTDSYAFMAGTIKDHLWIP